MLPVPYGFRNYSKAMTDAVHSVYCLTQWCYNANNILKQFFLPLLLCSSWPVCLNFALKAVTIFLVVSLAVLMSTSQIPVQENFLLWYNLAESHGTLPGSFTGTDSREVRIRNLRFGSIWIQVEVHVHVLLSCRKHSSGSRSRVSVPAICSSPFATLLLTTLSASSTVLDASSVMFPCCSPFSLSSRWVPKFRFSTVTFIATFSLPTFSVSFTS